MIDYRFGWICWFWDIGIFLVDMDFEQGTVFQILLAWGYILNLMLVFWTIRTILVAISIGTSFLDIVAAGVWIGFQLIL